MFTPISDAELAALIAAGGPVGDRLRDRILRIDQATRLADAVAASPIPDDPIVVGRIDAPGDGRRAFFDPDHPSADPRICFERVVDQERGETFKLERRIGYRDDDVGALLVPVDLGTFRTDLTSVPLLFTWLVPRTGVHLPAALIHDGLVHDAGEPRSYVGPPIDRVAADRMFRDGMRALGTGLIRRWLVWTAVAIATAWDAPVRRRRWWWRSAIVVCAAVVVVLGALATVDLFDCREALPWMGDRPLATELLLGGAMAAAIPAALALVLWPSQRRAGVIAGVSLALLLHVTLALVVLYSLYSVLENLRPLRPARVGLAVGGLVVAGALPLAFAWWACT